MLNYIEDSMRALFKISTISLIMIISIFQAQAAELLMFEHKGCIACKRFKAEVLQDYINSELGKKLPIRSIVQGSKDALKGLKLSGSPFYYSPTFVIVQDGKEIARIRGYLGKDRFWQVINNVYANKMNQLKS